MDLDAWWDNRLEDGSSLAPNTRVRRGCGLLNGLAVRGCRSSAWFWICDPAVSTSGFPEKWVSLRISWSRARTLQVQSRLAANCGKGHSQWRWLLLLLLFWRWMCFDESWILIWLWRGVNSPKTLPNASSEEKQTKDLATWGGAIWASPGLYLATDLFSWQWVTMGRCNSVAVGTSLSPSRFPVNSKQWWPIIPNEVRTLYTTSRREMSVCSSLQRFGSNWETFPLPSDCLSAARSWAPPLPRSSSGKGDGCSPCKSMGVFFLFWSNSTIFEKGNFCSGIVVRVAAGIAFAKKKSTSSRTDGRFGSFFVFFFC